MSIKGKLKFKAWESSALNGTLEKVLWQKNFIDNLCSELQQTPEQLDDILIDPEFLYEVLVAYEILSERLMEYELLASGYPKQTYTSH